MKKGIVLLSHGSKSPTANQELVDLSSQLEESLDIPVKGANLQFSKPDFWKAVDELISLEVKEIIIIPLFIFAGKHVKKDIPNLISKAEERYSKIKFTSTNHLAANNDLLKKLIASKLNIL
ncbi:sirohydrochlorin chelatase [Orenia marismortui]|uniref:sirohydrochlorin chelatase n=1 Tax=Orenia marismortui TaxID=46469 RepID=UPI00037B5C71|nr:CbiX/SirB N-terminal domain-containing protein [Orenia marismortui]